MPLLDIEKAIRSDAIRSRFRLVSMAAQRARELNANNDGTLPPQDYSHTKVTTSALSEVTNYKICAIDIAQEPVANEEEATE